MLILTRSRPIANVTPARYFARNFRMPSKLCGLTRVLLDSSAVIAAKLLVYFQRTYCCPTFNFFHGDSSRVQKFVYSDDNSRCNRDMNYLDGKTLDLLWHDAEPREL